MTMTLVDHADPRLSAAPSERLRLITAAVRVSFTWLGVRKTLTPEQKSRAAESFGAERDYLSARKKLLDTRHPACKEVSSIRNRTTDYWRGMTLPYPEPGVRLIRQDQIAAFNQRMNDLQTELQDAVVRLQDHYAELKEAAQRRLGDLFNPADYPPSLRGLFDLAWDFPNVQPPDYLLQLNPAIYEQEKTRIASRFEEAVRLAEQAFTTEFARLVSHLTERLSSPDGERKTFRNSAVVGGSPGLGQADAHGGHSGPVGRRATRVAGASREADEAEAADHEEKGRIGRRLQPGAPHDLFQTPSTIRTASCPRKNGNHRPCPTASLTWTTPSRSTTGHR